MLGLDLLQEVAPHWGRRLNVLAQMRWQGAVANGQPRLVEYLVVCKLEGAPWKHESTAIWMPEQPDSQSVHTAELVLATAANVQQGQSTSNAAPLDVQNMQGVRVVQHQK